MSKTNNETTDISIESQTNPKIIGPGTWRIIHTQARNVSLIPIENPEQISKAEDDFIKLLKSICADFGCPVCRVHCGEYIQNNPPESAKGLLTLIGDKKIEIGMFRWTWEFHNVVNKRLGKTIMSFENAYKIFYREGESCSKVCNDAV